MCSRRDRQKLFLNLITMSIEPENCRIFSIWKFVKRICKFCKSMKKKSKKLSPILELNIFGWNCFFLSMASRAESVQNWARDVLVSCKIEFLKNNKTICPKLNWKRTHFKHNNSGEKQNLSLHFPLLSYSLEFMDGISLKFKFMRHSPIGCCNKIKFKIFHTYLLSASQASTSSFSSKL